MKETCPSWTIPLEPKIMIVSGIVLRSTGVASVANKKVIVKILHGIHRMQPRRNDEVPHVRHKRYKRVARGLK